MKRKPSPLLSLVPIVVLVSLLFAIIRVFGSEALNGGSQVALLTTTAVCVLIGMAVCKTRWHDFELAITNNISGVATALIVLLIIGALSGAWMVSGVVPTLIYYGVQIIHPNFFLASTCIICSLVSVMTGSSWTTIATIGIALMGIGKAQGFDEGWIAGAIISGAYFGDKISPLSDTTILASSVTDTPLFTHIRYMLITTIPSMLITLVIFTVAGLSHEASHTEHIAAFSASIHDKFYITPWLLLVPVITGVLIARKVPSLVTLFLSTALAAVFAVIFQPHLLQEIAGSASSNAEALFKGALMTIYGETGLRSTHRTGCHKRYGGHAQHSVAHCVCHVFWWSDDGKRHAGKYHIGICTFHEAPHRHGGFDCMLGYFPQYNHGRSVYLYHSDRKYVWQYL